MTFVVVYMHVFVHSLGKQRIQQLAHLTLTKLFENRLTKHHSDGVVISRGISLDLYGYCPFQTASLRNVHKNQNKFHRKSLSLQ